MFSFLGLRSLFIVIGVIYIINLYLVSAGKDKGESIIMDGDSLIMQDHKKKKGDTIVIRSSSCECAKKTVPVPVPVPYPVMVPQKEVKYVHVPVHHGGWFGGHEMMHEGFARSDDIMPETLERPAIGIGERIAPIDYDLPVEADSRVEPVPPMVPDEMGILYPAR